MDSTVTGLDIEKLNHTVLCYAQNVYRFNGVWEGPDPLTPLISLFLIQLTVAIAVNRLLLFGLRPFNQPPFVSDILGGILLGPSAFGRIEGFRKLIFPYYSFKVLEPMAHLSIIYYAFLVGLKMDIRAVLRTGPKAVKVAVAGIVIPFCLGSGSYFCVNFSKDSDPKGFLFWGAALTVTGFSVLTKILDQQQILHTEIGKTAMTSALINDLSGWGFLALAFSVSSNPSGIHFSIICTSAFVLLCVYYVRPALGWIIRKTPEGQGYSEFYLCSVLTGVALCGVITDACGTHPMIGAFTFGLIIPNEVLEAALVDKLEDFVLGILMPVFYVVCGLRTNIDIISSETSWYVVGLVIVLACSAKILSSLFVSLLCDFSPMEAMAIGILTNTKSIMVMIILEAGQIQMVHDSGGSPGNDNGSPANGNLVPAHKKYNTLQASDNAECQIRRRASYPCLFIQHAQRSLPHQPPQDFKCHQDISNQRLRPPASRACGACHRNAGGPQFTQGWT